jgi:hypothetical protein
MTIENVRGFRRRLCFLENVKRHRSAVTKMSKDSGSMDRTLAVVPRRQRRRRITRNSVRSRRHSQRFPHVQAPTFCATDEKPRSRTNNCPMSARYA